MYLSQGDKVQNPPGWQVFMTLVSHLYLLQGDKVKKKNLGGRYSCQSGNYHRVTRYKTHLGGRYS